MGARKELREDAAGALKCRAKLVLIEVGLHPLTSIGTHIGLQGGSLTIAYVTLVRIARKLPLFLSRSVLDVGT